MKAMINKKKRITSSLSSSVESAAVGLAAVSAAVGLAAAAEHL